MREFDRITIDPNVANGLPCIRDTGITVSEVVKAIQSGKSFREMKAIYFELDDEDIHQAQGYAIRDLIEGIAVYKTEGLTPLITIRGYAEILFDKVEGQHFELDSETRNKFIDILFQCTWRGMAEWGNLREWSGYNYEYHGLQPYPTSITGLIDDLKENIFRHDPSASIKIINKVTQTQAAVNLHATSAIVHLATDLKHDLSLDTLLIIESQNRKHIHFEISRPIKSESAILHLQENFHRYRMFPIGTASTIISSLNGKLSVQIKDDIAVFLFDLPNLNSDNHS